MMAQSPTSPTSETLSADAAGTGNLEVNDCVFCQHGKEVCNDCDFDGREENDTFFGLDPKERSPMELPPSIVNKAGVYQCKKHGNSGCNQCYGWKKQITKLQREATKNRKKN